MGIFDLTCINRFKKAAGRPHRDRIQALRERLYPVRPSPICAPGHPVPSFSPCPVFSSRSKGGNPNSARSSARFT